MTKKIAIFIICYFSFQSVCIAEQTQLLLIDRMTGWDGQRYTKLQVLAAQAGADLSLSVGYRGSIPTLDRFAGVIAITGGGGMNQRGYGGVEEGELLDLSLYAKSGGRVAIFILPKLAEFNSTLNTEFGFMIVQEHVTPTDSRQIEVEGSILSPLWDGLIVGSNTPYAERRSISNIALRSYLEPIGSQHMLARPQRSASTRIERTLGLKGTIGKGDFLAITAFSTGGGGILYRARANMLTDDNLDFQDNRTAAQRLLAWLINNPQSAQAFGDHVGAALSHQKCGTCANRYPIDFRFCPYDGNALVPIETLIQTTNKVEAGASSTHEVSGQIYTPLIDDLLNLALDRAGIDPDSEDAKHAKQFAKDALNPFKSAADIQREINSIVERFQN